MLEHDIIKRDLPKLFVMNDGTLCTPELWRKRREELLDILKQNIYGNTPEPPKSIKGIVEDTDMNAFAGKVISQRINIKFDTPGGSKVFVCIQRGDGQPCGPAL